MMDLSTHEKVTGMLHSAGLRHTRTRASILNVLLKAHGALTQEQIAQRIKNHPTDKVTIYRTLESFAAAGLVHRAYQQHRCWHYELAHRCTNVQCHPHFFCRNCGVARCLHNTQIPLVKGLEKGFVIERQQVRLEGLCPECSRALQENGKEFKDAAG